MIDAAVLRPGRLDKLGPHIHVHYHEFRGLTRIIVYVDLPSPDARFEILKTHARKVTLDAEVDLKQIANDQRCVRGSIPRLY